MTKSFRSCLFCSFMVLLFAGCSLNLSSTGASSGSKQQVSPTQDGASLTINLLGSDSVKSKSVINVQSNQIIGATLSLVGGYNSYNTNWVPGQAYSYVFQALSTAAYTLTITDWDNAGHTNTANAVINIQNGYNYSINVQLGGQIYINPVSNVPISNLIAEYVLSGNANDYSGYVNNGVLNNITFVSDRFGNPNSAAHFTGNVNSYINCSANISNYLTNQITVSFWFRTATYTNQAILGKYGNDQSGGFRFAEISNGYVFFGVANGADHFLTNTNGPFSLNNYHHIVGVYNKSIGYFALYIDDVITVGAAYTTGNLNYTPQPTNPDCANFELGRIWSSGVNFEIVPVDIDDVRVYNRALTDSEIQALYHEGGWGN